MQTHIEIPSNSAKICNASWREFPQISGSALKLPHILGRIGELKIVQEKSGARFTHGTPAGLPCSIPGIADDIEGIIQHAPQPGRQL